MSSVVAQLHSKVMHAVEAKDKATVLQFQEHLLPGAHAVVRIESGGNRMLASAYLKALTSRQRSALGLQ